MTATPDQPSRLRDPEAGFADGVTRGGTPPASPQHPTRRGRRTNTPGSRPPIGVATERSGGARPSRRAPLVVAAVVATVWAAMLSYIPVAAVLGIVQLAADGGTLDGAARVALAGWLLGHGVPLTTGIGPLGLVPLAIAGLAAWRVARAGVHTTRALGARRTGSPRQAYAIAGTIGTTYGLLGTLAAAIADAGDLAVSPARAGLTLTAFGALAALVGAVLSTGALDLIAARTPALVRDGMRVGVVAAMLLLAAGAAAVGLAVAIDGGDAGGMIGAYRTGVAGQAGITLISMAYAPNVAVWGASYLLGPGFAVGTETAVRTTAVTVGALPSLPLIAGLPHGPVGGVGAALLTVPVLAGMAAGCLLARRRLRAARHDRSPVRWSGLLSAAAIGGPVAGGILGLVAVLSGGSLGGGRLAEIGPVGWQVAAAATMVIAVGTVVGAAATRAFVRS
jgi:hypothetical protein